MAKEAVSPQLLRLELHVFEVLWWCFKWDLWGFALQNGSFIAASLCLVNGGALYFSACQEAVFSTPAREPGFKPRPCWRSWAPHSLEFGFEKSCSATKSIISIILHVRVFKMQLQKSIFYHNSLYSTLCGKCCCWTKGRYSISNGISAAGCVGQRSQSAVQTGKVIRPDTFRLCEQQSGTEESTPSRRDNKESSFTINTQISSSRLLQSPVFLILLLLSTLCFQFQFPSVVKVLLSRLLTFLYQRQIT